MSVKDIVIARDFAVVPGGRYRVTSEFSGEQFRDDILAPALKNNDEVSVDLDGTKTFMSSFLEEAFGGLIRVSGFTLPELEKRLRIRAVGGQYAIFLKMIDQYLHDAAAAKAGSTPRVA